MGVPESSGSQQTSAMKIFFFALAVLAAYAVADAEPAADANADADADAWYRSYYGHGLGYYGGYRGYYGYGLGHYGYRGYYGYGKRSADAEPTAAATPAADADADPYYLGYHGLGLGYRAYGYGYPVTTTRWGGYRGGYYW